MNAIVLAGGNSTRFIKLSKPSKAFLPIDGRTIIETIICKLERVFDQVYVVAGENNAFDYLKTVYSGIKIIKDKIPGKNSLGGIYSGLLDSDSMYNFVIACDMPFINEKLMRFLAKRSSGYDLTVPVVNDHFEALHAVYSKNCIPSIEEQLAKGNLKVIDFFYKVKLQTVPEEIIKSFDPKLHAFVNINNNEEYMKALLISSESPVGFLQFC
jgi:molybdenum cofactor guanylyltransferase